MNKTLRSCTREVIYKVYRRCLLEYEAKSLLTDLDDVFQRTADMTGKSLSTIRRVVQEGKYNHGKFSTPGKHRQGRPKKCLDNFDLCAIRQKIQFFYTVRKQVPTLRSLLPIVRADLGFTGSREHLRKVLKAIGFKFRKCQSDRNALMELPPYHCDLNPIELIWGIAKQKIASVNVGTIDIKEAAERAFEEISVDDWNNSCQHVMKIEREYYERSNTLYQEIDRLVINLQDDSDVASSDVTDRGEDELEVSEAGPGQDMDFVFSGVEYLDEDALD